jgi:hypothetical protein
MTKLYNYSSNIAILTRPDYRSPRILAESLKLQLEKAGAKATVFLSTDELTRLRRYKDYRIKVKLHYWLRKKIANYFSDKQFLKRLKSYDAIVICECSPNGFWRDYYHIEDLRIILKVPILFYEVYYLGNSPTQLKKLRESGEATLERYDWHLSVSDVTEIRSQSSHLWSCIGVDLSASSLVPTVKEEFVALIDFPQQGYERYREEQLSVLRELDIKIIILSGDYTIAEIRSIYKRTVVYFMQSHEAFGMPIAETLACGAVIMTPSSAWPMSWRLDEHPKVHGDGLLPDIFTTYSNRNDLKSKLLEIKRNYNLKKTPFQIFDSFVKHYPHYYYGNMHQLKDVLHRIQEQ